MLVRDDFERKPVAVERLDEQVEALVGDNPAERQEIIFFLMFANDECFRVDAGVEDFGFPAVKFGDAFCGRTGIRYEGVHSLRGEIVPNPELMEHAWHDKSGERVEPSEFWILLVFVGMAPVVPRRGMAVADMPGVRAGNDSLGFGAGTRNDDVVPGEVERFERAGPEERNHFWTIPEERDFLEEGGGDSSFELWEMLRIKDRAVHVSVRYDLEHVVEHLFGTAPVLEPVANDGNFELFYVHVKNLFREKDTMSILALSKS